VCEFDAKAQSCKDPQREKPQDAATEHGTADRQDNLVFKKKVTRDSIIDRLEETDESCLSVSQAFFLHFVFFAILCNFASLRRKHKVEIAPRAFAVGCSVGMIDRTTSREL
jgi:hypothetical protein